MLRNQFISFLKFCWYENKLIGPEANPRAFPVNDDEVSFVYEEALEKVSRIVRELIFNDQDFVICSSLITDSALIELEYNENPLVLTLPSVAGNNLFLQPVYLFLTFFSAELSSFLSETHTYKVHYHHRQPKITE